jgi:hypothetical protein
MSELPRSWSPEIPRICKRTSYGGKYDDIIFPYALQYKELLRDKAYAMS